MTKPMCDLCGAQAVHEARPRMVAYKGHKFKINQPATYCDTCGDATLSGEDRKETRKAIAEFHAEVDDLVGPDEVRRIRKDVLHVTQKDAALALGGGPNAFSRYERGELLVSGSTSILLKLADSSNDTCEKIKAMIDERAKTA